MKRFSIVRVVAAKLLIPYILLFAFYVQFHGDFGPGGGFQAGVIFASGFILYSLVFGLDAARKVARPRVIERLVALGVVLYAGVGVATMLLGGNCTLCQGLMSSTGDLLWSKNCVRPSICNGKLV